MHNYLVISLKKISSDLMPDIFFVSKGRILKEG